MWRTLLYNGKSETADTHVHVSPTGQVAPVFFTGKYIGDKSEGAG